MNKTLLFISFIICYSITNSICAQSEQNLLEKYQSEFTTRSLSSSNKKAINGINELGEKVIFITYEQIQSSKESTGNLKSLVLTSKENRITDVTFIYGSISLIDENLEKGNSVFRISSQNILNKKGETSYLKNRYEVIVVNGHDKEIFDVSLEADLYISASAFENIALITKKYNEAYKTRTIKELNDLGLFLVTSENGYNETNEILLRMIMKEREAVINQILKDYNSYFRIEIPKFIASPDQLWNEFYIDPIKYINTIYNNSPLLKKEAQEDVAIEHIKIGDNHAGGIVFMVDSSGMHGLVCAPKDQGVLKWGEAKNSCLNLSLNGYSDWYLPSESELNLLRENIGQGNNLGLGNIGGFNDYGYWSSNHFLNKAKGLSFNSGVHFEKDINTYSHARAIRAF